MTTSHRRSAVGIAALGLALPTAASDAAQIGQSAPVAREWAGAWLDVTDEAIGNTAEWTNKVELADIDVDGQAACCWALVAASSPMSPPQTFPPPN